MHKIYSLSDLSMCTNLVAQIRLKFEQNPSTPLVIKPKLNNTVDVDNKINFYQSLIDEYQKSIILAKTSKLSRNKNIRVICSDMLSRKVVNLQFTKDEEICEIKFCKDNNKNQTSSENSSKEITKSEFSEHKSMKETIKAIFLNENINKLDLHNGKNEILKGKLLKGMNQKLLNLFGWVYRNQKQKNSKQSSYNAIEEVDGTFTNIMEVFYISWYDRNPDYKKLEIYFQ